MTKKDIAIRISDETGIKQIVVKEIIQKTLDTMVDILATGETIELRNFGIFKVKTRRGRLGRNPRTGDSVPIPDKKVVSFNAGMKMKQDVATSS